MATGEISRLLSVGWAGALNATATAGQVMQPSFVIDGLSGKRYETSGPDGTLVTVQVVADVEEKRRLGELYKGDYVDMKPPRWWKPRRKPDFPSNASKPSPTRTMLGFPI